MTNHFHRLSNLMVCHLTDFKHNQLYKNFVSDAECPKAPNGDQFFVGLNLCP